MGRSTTNAFNLQYSIEETPGNLFVSPEWKIVEPNGISTFAASIETVRRTPISKDRQNRKGTIVDLDSSVEFEADLTLEHFIDFIEGFCFSNFIGPEKTIPTAATATEFTIPAITTPLPEDTLVYSRGWILADNNGLFEVAAGGTTTAILVEGGLTAETAASEQNVSVDVCGFRFAAGDLEINADLNLETTTKDFTELGLAVGQSVWIGGDLAINQFDESANTGFARIVTISTNIIVIDKTSQTFVEDDGGTNLVDLYFGKFVRNVPVDDGDFLERSFQFEGAYENLAEPGPGDAYAYSVGNYCNSLAFNLALTDKATMTVGFIGLDTDSPTTSRATNADTPKVPEQTGAFNTSADIARLRVQNVDESGLTTDFKSITLTLNNNIVAEKVLGRIGARYMNYGNFDVSLETQIVFTDPDIIEAVRVNRTVTMDFSIENDDGAFLVDIPSLILGGGEQELPVNESILLNVIGAAFGDTTTNTSIGVSMFPYKPTE